jgi:hypothetical protein
MRAQQHSPAGKHHNHQEVSRPNQFATVLVQIKVSQIFTCLRRQSL